MKDKFKEMADYLAVKHCQAMKHRSIMMDNSHALPCYKCEEASKDIAAALSEAYEKGIKSLESRLKVQCEANDVLTKKLKLEHSKIEWHAELYRANTKIEELESRLKEAVSKGENLCTAHGLLLCDHDTLKKQFAEAEHRLSQAEDENAFLKKQIDGLNHVSSIDFLDNKSLKARLSHLMDVAKKLVVQIDAEGGHGYAVHGLCDKLKIEFGEK